MVHEICYVCIYLRTFLFYRSLLLLCWHRTHWYLCTQQKIMPNAPLGIEYVVSERRHDRPQYHLIFKSICTTRCHQSLSVPFYPLRIESPPNFFPCLSHCDGEPCWNPQDPLTFRERIFSAFSFLSRVHPLVNCDQNIEILLHPVQKRILSQPSPSFWVHILSRHSPSTAFSVLSRAHPLVNCAPHIQFESASSHSLLSP